MKHSILLLILLSALSANLLAADNTLVLQKDLISHSWLQKDSLTKSVNPGAFTRLMAAYTALQMIESREKAKDATAERKEITLQKGLEKNIKLLFISLTEPQYRELLKALDTNDKAFVEAMNQNAETLGMEDSHFTSVFPTNDRKHRTTPKDLALLTEAVFRYQLLRQAPTSLSDSILDSQRGRRNFNAGILQTPFVFGGYLGNSWSGVFISENAYDSGRFRRLFSIVLDANSVEDLTDRAAQIIKHGFTSSETLPLFNAGETVGEIIVAHGDTRKLSVYVREDIFVTIKKSDLENNKTEAFKILISHASPLKAPIAKGEEVGKMTAFLHDQALLEVPVFAKSTVNTGNFWQRFTDTVRFALNSQETKDNH